MPGNPILRTLAIAASAALLMTALAAPAATAEDCTYEFTAAGALPSEYVPVQSDWLICGNRDHNHIHGDVYGTFTGGKGRDFVHGSLYGTFEGGPDLDYVSYLRGGTYEGGPGPDLVRNAMCSGTFTSGPDEDIVLGWMCGGAFVGGPGNDSVRNYCSGRLQGVESVQPGWDCATRCADECD